MKISKKNKFNVTLKLSLLLFIFSFAITSCSSDDDAPTVDPPTAEKVTYTKNVKAIIDGNCLGCHGEPLENGAPVHLTNYDEVKASSVKVASKVADGSMPAGGGSLTAAQKKVIADWAKDGFLE